MTLQIGTRRIAMLEPVSKGSWVAKLSKRLSIDNPGTHNVQNGTSTTSNGPSSTNSSEDMAQATFGIDSLSGTRRNEYAQLIKDRILQQQQHTQLQHEKSSYSSLKEHEIEKEGSVEIVGELSTELKSSRLPSTGRPKISTAKSFDVPENTRIGRFTVQTTNSASGALEDISTTGAAEVREKNKTGGNLSNFARQTCHTMSLNRKN